MTRTVRRSEALEDRLSAERVASLDAYELAAVRLAFTNGKATARELASHIGRTRRTAGNVLKGISGPSGPLEWRGSAVNDPGQYHSLR